MVELPEDVKFFVEEVEKRGFKPRKVAVEDVVGLYLVWEPEEREGRRVWKYVGPQTSHEVMKEPTMIACGRYTCALFVDDEIRLAYERDVRRVHEREGCRGIPMSWEEIGRLYIEKAKKADPWTCMTYGLVHSNLRSVAKDVEAAKALKEIAPSPEEGRRKCPLPRSELAKLAKFDFYNLRTVAEGFCDKAVNYEKVAPLFKGCKRRELQEMKLERMKTGREDLDVVGLKWKGIDMTLLDCGCEIPVVDLHIARHLARNDPEARKILGDPSDAKEFRKRLDLAQDDLRLYNALWNIALGMAEKEGLSPGVWHVKTWMREHFASEYPKLPEEKRVELARRYVERQFT